MLKIAKVLVSAEDIESKLAEMGAAITEDYRDKDLLMIGVLKGAFMVMADLARHVRSPIEFDFMAVSSYGAATKTS
ncbi:MAG: hypoxanthine phosphoribosyltransferase, partial [Acidimicrobiia bacterium]|nr:hypoxanthine phosphoribosyltransferase [Acidimicrobiia bacterium]